MSAGEVVGRTVEEVDWSCQFERLGVV